VFSDTLNLRQHVQWEFGQGPGWAGETDFYQFLTGNSQSQEKEQIKEETCTLGRWYDKT
jgi:hypothetical protein